jgi:hypothetical protein
VERSGRGSLRGSFFGIYIDRACFGNFLSCDAAEFWTRNLLNKSQKLWGNPFSSGKVLLLLSKYKSRPPLWSSGQSSWLLNGDVLCFLWGTNWIYICYVEESRPPLWSSGQSSWLLNGDVLCFLWGTNWIYICYVEESRPPLWSRGQGSWLHNGDVLCFLWGTNWIYTSVLYVEESKPPLWSSGQSFWLQIQKSRFDSRRYRIFWELMGLERGPLSLVSTTKELLERKLAAPVLKTENTSIRIRNADHMAPSICELWH